MPASTLRQVGATSATLLRFRRQTREDRDQRGANPARSGGGVARIALSTALATAAEIARDAGEAEATTTAGDAPPLKRLRASFKPSALIQQCGNWRAPIVQADDDAGARQHGADEEANAWHSTAPAQADRRNRIAPRGDGKVMAQEVGDGALADRRGDLAMRSLRRKPPGSGGRPRTVGDGKQRAMSAKISRGNIFNLKGAGFMDGRGPAGCPHRPTPESLVLRRALVAGTARRRVEVDHGASARGTHETLEQRGSRSGRAEQAARRTSRARDLGG